MQPKGGETPICAFYDLTEWVNTLWFHVMTCLNTHPVYYSNSNPFWSDVGCLLVETTERYTLCSCDHLTHFAVLFDARGTNSKVNNIV